MTTQESTCWTVVRAAADGRVPSFRAFLYSVVRNVARRFESRPVRLADPLPDVAANEDSLSRVVSGE